MSDIGCYRCGFNHERDVSCIDAKWERIDAYVEECKRIVAEARAAESRPVEPEPDKENAT